MNRHVALLALLLTPATAFAQTEYHVTGPGLVGRATVTPAGAAVGGDRRVDVLLSYRGVAPSAAVRQVQGRGVLRRTGILEWTPGGATTPRDALLNGIVDHLTGSVRPPTGGVGGPLNRSTYVLSPFNGALVGVVENTQQTWTPATTTPAARRNATRQNLVVLVVAGWSLPPRAGFGAATPSYLDANVAAVAVRGLPVQRVTTRPLDPVLANARLVADAVVAQARQGRRTILLAHGKGAADATAAIALAPQLERYVAGLVALQPVYGGSPVLDWIASGQARQIRAVNLLERQLFQGATAPGFGYGHGGYGAPPPVQPTATWLDMTTAQRAIFVAQYPYPAQRVPTVVVRTTIQRNDFSLLSATEPLLRQTFNQASDGLVTTVGQTIPGATHLDVADVDHFEGGLQGRSRTSPAALTNQALTALLNQLPTSSFGVPGHVPSVSFNLGPVRIDLPLGQ